MDIDYLSTVLARLRPFVRDGVIRRTRLERVLGAVDRPADDIRPDVEFLLSKAKIRIDEDQSQEAAIDPGASDLGSADHPEGRSSDGSQDRRRALDVDERESAVAAARNRIAQDRHVPNPASVLLTAQQEVGLAILIRGPEGQPLEPGEFASLTGEAREAAECLFLHNQRLVHSVAQKYPQTGMSYDDVVQHGMTGLIRAVEKFDPGHGTKFSTYSTWWIRQSITRGIANEARLIRLPVHMVDRLNKVWNARERLTVQGKPPNVYQLSRECKITEEQVVECLRLGPPDLVSLDMKIGDGETTLADVLDLADPELDPSRQIEFVLLQEQIRAVLDMLSEREARVIDMRFGLSTGEQMTLDEIGKIFGVTRERIRQIERKTLDMLRENSYSAVLEPYFYGGGARPRPQPSDPEEAEECQ